MEERFRLMEEIGDKIEIQENAVIVHYVNHNEIDKICRLSSEYFYPIVCYPNEIELYKEYAALENINMPDPVTWGCFKKAKKSHNGYIQPI